jgi:TPR repeat protein
MAMQALAFMYRDGEGVNKNPDEAQRWMNRAVAAQRELAARQQRAGNGATASTSGE